MDITTLLRIRPKLLRPQLPADFHREPPRKKQSSCASGREKEAESLYYREARASRGLRSPGSRQELRQANSIHRRESITFDGTTCSTFSLFSTSDARIRSYPAHSIKSGQSGRRRLDRVTLGQGRRSGEKRLRPLEAPGSQGGAEEGGGSRGPGEFKSNFDVGKSAAKGFPTDRYGPLIAN